MKKFVLAVSLLFALVSPVQAKFDPSFTWTTLETPHFLIHYHQGGEGLAKRTAEIAEDVHARLVPRIKWQPEDKTQVVLVDEMDEANGMTSVFPYNQMILFLTPPLGEPGFGTTPYDDWMRMLITHEYTHVLQLDMVTGGYGWVFRTLFGRSVFSFPNAVQPEWLIEGLAVYEETSQTGGGRGRSAGADMVLRMATLEGPFPSISQMTVFPDTWPSGDVPYLFGDSFIQFIGDNYGRESLAELSRIYSGRVFPFLVDSTGRRALRSGYAELYRQWRALLKDRYEKQADAVTAKGVTASNALTRKGYETLSPALSPDGTRIAYTVSNGDEFPGIYLMNADGSGDRKVAELFFPFSGMKLAWSADGNRLYYTRLEFVRNTNIYDDIYYHDMKKDREVRVTAQVRARDPHPSPDGSKLVFVVNKLGRTRLALLDLSQKKLPAEAGDIVFLTDDELLYEGPRWSPDGSRIAVGVWQPGGSKDIWILDSQGKKMEEVTHDKAIDGSPAWSADGNYLYFSSDRTGIFNIYAYEVGTKTISRVTNALGGAFSPSPSADNGKLVFTSYSAKGYDVHAMNADRSSWKAAEPYRTVYPAEPYEAKAVETSTRPYSPLPTLAPRYWLPWFGYSYESGALAGFLTSGQDVVQHHQYFATGLYGPKANRLWYSFDYLYDGLYPTFHLSASDQDATYANLLIDPYLQRRDYVERQRTYGAEMIVPLLKMRRQHALSIGYQWQEATALSQILPSVDKPWLVYQPPLPFEGVLASGRASYLYNSAQRYGFSISPENGRTIELGYERFDTSLGSDLELSKYTADWHEYINFPWPHHVLQARAFAGTSHGQQFPQSAFQLGGDMPGDVTLTINDREVYLRGYPIAEFRGQNVGLLSFEYRMPLLNIEKGGGQTPFFLRRLHGALFAEAGNAWDSGAIHATDWKRAVGAEARLDLDLAYGWAPVTLRLGVARGLDEEGEWQLIWNAWVALF